MGGAKGRQEIPERRNSISIFCMSNPTSRMTTRAGQRRHLDDVVEVAQVSSEEMVSCLESRFSKLQGVIFYLNRNRCEV